MFLTSNATLEAFVIESNGIEGIPATLGLYHDAHLGAAKAVRDNPDRALADIKGLHRYFGRVFEDLVPVAEYRSVPVSVGRRQLPAPGHLLPLMGEFDEAVNYFCAQAFSSESELAAVCAFNLHHTFVCIHPFGDGNGRLARLILNALRLKAGLPWYTVKQQSIESYFNTIRKYEEQTFRPAHLWAYDGAA